MDLRNTRNLFVLLNLFFVVTAGFLGCVARHAATPAQPAYLERAQTQADGKVSVTIAVLTDREAKRIFGVSLAKRGIQPVWVNVENKDNIPHVFVPRSMDPEYFSYEEAAYRCHLSRSKRILGEGLLSIIFFPGLVLIPIDLVNIRVANKKMDAAFADQAFRRNIVMPGSASSGFVFTTLDEGTKIVPVGLFSSSGLKQFSFTAKVPGIRPDYTTKDIASRYPEEKIVAVDEEGLFKALQELPCCATNKRGSRNGDPINLVIIGEIEDVLGAFSAVKWNETESLSLKSGSKMARSFFTDSDYRYSPVSPLYLKGHSHDIAIQKIHDTIKERLHLRLWYSPLRFNDKPVWVGTISRDIGVRMTWRTWHLTTHKIDSNIDDSRDYLLADLAAEQRVSRFGFISLGGPVHSSAPRKNLTGDPYFTDNMRVVIELSADVTDPKTFSWNHPISDTNVK